MFKHFPGFSHAIGDSAARALQADGFNCLEKLVTIFSSMDNIPCCANHLHAKPIQNAIIKQLTGAVQSCLAAERRQEGIDLVAPTMFFFNDLGDSVCSDRLDIGPVSHLRIGHDRRRIRVDQDDLKTFLPQRFTCLSA